MNPRTATGHELVGPYEIVKAIGAGGSARVDLARIQRAYGFQRHIVIKRPLEHLRSDPRVAASLRREARLGTRLRHPNLVTILDAGEHDGYDYLVLEYIQGGSLRSLVETEEATRIRDLPLGVALAIVSDVARGLHQAHELADEQGSPLGLVHRDVSPGNVLIGADGTVKLADFGIAKETRVQTLSGAMHGTVTYMAPEQCRGHAIDRRADVFSLGVILYELVTGTRLYLADNDVASLHRVLSGQVVRPRKVRPGVPVAIEDLVMSAIAHDPERRLATAGALAEAIEDHAAATGELLAARRIARWVHDLIGPRDAPWVGDETVVDSVPAPPEPDPVIPSSLVKLIAATPDDEPHAMAFGPTDDPEIDTEPRRSPAVVPGRGRMIAAILAGGAVVGSVLAVLAMRGGDETTPAASSISAPAVAAPVRAPVAAPTPVPATVPAPTRSTPVESTMPGPSPSAPVPAPPSDPRRTAVDPTEPAPDLIEIEHAAADPRSRTRKQKRPTTRPAITKPTAGSGSGSGSGSAAPPTKPPRPNVEWTPDILLPTDKAPAGSGTNKR